MLDVGSCCLSPQEGWTWQGVQGICERVSHPLVLWLCGRGIVEYPELGPPGPAEPPQNPPVPGSCSCRELLVEAKHWSCLGTGCWDRREPLSVPQPWGCSLQGSQLLSPSPGKQDMLFVVIIIIILMFSWQSSPSLHGGYCVSPRSQKCSPTSACARPCRHLMMKLLLLLFAGIFRVGVDLCFYPC